MSEQSRPDKGTTINTIVQLAAAAMASKAEEMKLIASMRIERYGADDFTANKLLSDAAKINDAVDVMDEHGGCWS